MSPDKTSDRPQIPIGEKLACSISETAELSGVCRTLIYREINAGRLIAHKAGTRTIILRTDREDWLKALPCGIGPQPKWLKQGQKPNPQEAGAA